MKLKIYRGLTLFAEPEIDLQTEFNEVLMGVDEINCNIISPTPLLLELDDHVIFRNENYFIDIIPENTTIDGNSNQYNITFKHPKFRLNADFISHLGDTQFTYFGDAQAFMSLLLGCIHDFDPAYVLGEIEPTEQIFISFDGNTYLQALVLIAEAFGLEYKIRGKVIDLKKQIGTDTNLTFEYGRGKGLYSLTRKAINDENVVNKVYGFGSSQNIDYTYRNGAKRLTFEGGFLTAVTPYGLRAGIYTNDKIKPERTAPVTQVEAIQGNGFAIYDTTLDFDIRDYLQEGVVGKVIFKSGDLSGQEFEITGYNHLTKKISLSTFTENDGYILPNATFMVKEGDLYTLVDMNQPPVYVADAEARLQLETQAYLNENKIPKVAYDLPIDPKYIRTLGASLRAGDLVTIIDDKHGVNHKLRVIGVRLSLVDESDVKVTIANFVPYTFEERVIASAINNQKEIKEISRTREADAKRASMNLRTLASSIFDTDGLFDSDKINVGVLSAALGIFGVQSQNFSISRSVFKENYGGNANSFQITNGTLIHREIEIAGGGNTWVMDGVTVTDLTPSFLYYVYAKISKSTLTGSYLITTDQIKVEDQIGHYVLLVGVLYPVFEGTRDYDATHGVSTISGGRIQTGEISSLDGFSKWNLDTGALKLGDKFNYEDGNLSIQGSITVTGGNAETKTGAQDKADQAKIAAENAAKAYAEAQDLLKQAEIEAYADGIVTAEEQARINQAAANLAAAKADATAKANAAEAAASALANDAQQTATDAKSYIDNVLPGVLDDIYDSLDGLMEQHFHNYDALSTNLPASSWTTTALKESHLGDLFYNTANGKSWRWVKDGGGYFWKEIVNSDLQAALELASKAQDTADAKRRVFTVQPFTPYDVGDMWLQGTGGDIMRCATPRIVSQIYVASDWVKASKYTDDTAVNELEIGGRNLINKNNFLNRSGYNNIKLKDYKIELSASSNDIGGYIVKVSPGTTYTVSFKGIVLETRLIQFLNYPTDILSGSITQRFASPFTFTTAPDTEYITIGFYGASNTSYPIYTYEWQLEKGNKPTDWTPAPEDVTAAIAVVQGEIDEVQGELNDLDIYVDGAFKDNVISSAEAKAIEKYLNSINTEKSDVDNKYTTIYANTNLTGTAKTNLLSAKTAWNTAHTNLITSINTAISGGTTTPAQKTDVDSKFTAYRNALALLAQRFEQAADSIAQGKVDGIEIGGRNYIRGSNSDNWMSYTNANVTISSGEQVTIRATRVGAAAVFGIMQTVPSRTMKLEKGDTYTLSFEVRGKTSLDLNYLYLMNLPSPNEDFPSAGFISSETKFTKVSTTKIYNSESPLSYLMISVNTVGNIGDWFEVKNINLEKSTKAGDWSPAHEDVAAEITQVRTDLRLTAPLPSALKMDADGFTATLTGNPNAYARLNGQGLLVAGGAINIMTSNQNLRGVQFDSAGIRGYSNAGATMFSLDAATGKMTAVDGIFSGHVVMTSGTVQGSFIAGTINANSVSIVNLSASNINTGTLNGNNVTVVNLSASAITSGTINSARIDTVTLIGSSYLMAGTQAGLAGQGTGAGEIRIFAGQTYANRASAPFRVTQAGALVATNATITGHIVANSGSFTGAITATSGSFTGSITTAALSATGGTIGGIQINSGNIKSTNGNFEVTSAGAMTAKSGTFGGILIESNSIRSANNAFIVTSGGAVTMTNLTATGGTIGGFLIESNRLSNANVNTALNFSNLSGSAETWLRINNDSSSPILNIRSDQANRVAVELGTNGNNTFALKITAQRVSGTVATAIDSNGTHVFHQRAGEFWNAPGVLAAGAFNSDTGGVDSFSNIWSIRPLTISISKVSANVAQVTHNLGHTDYTVIVSSRRGDGMAHLITKTTTSFQIAGDEFFRSAQIHFIMIGRNRI